MKKTAITLVLAVFLVVATGCASSAGFSAGKVNAGVHTRAHAWEKPSFNHDLTTNPVTSEAGLGFVTVGSQAGFGDHPDGQWVSIGGAIGPK